MHITFVNMHCECGAPGETIYPLNWIQVLIPGSLFVEESPEGIERNTFIKILKRLNAVFMYTPPLIESYPMMLLPKL